MEFNYNSRRNSNASDSGNPFGSDNLDDNLGIGNEPQVLSDFLDESGYQLDYDINELPPLPPSPELESDIKEKVELRMNEAECYQSLLPQLPAGFKICDGSQQSVQMLPNYHLEVRLPQVSYDPTQQYLSLPVAQSVPEYSLPEEVRIQISPNLRFPRYTTRSSTIGPHPSTSAGGDFVRSAATGDLISNKWDYAENHEGAPLPSFASIASKDYPKFTPDMYSTSLLHAHGQVLLDHYEEGFSQAQQLPMADIMSGEPFPAPCYSSIPVAAGAASIIQPSPRVWLDPFPNLKRALASECNTFKKQISPFPPEPPAPVNVPAKPKRKTATERGRGRRKVGDDHCDPEPRVQVEDANAGTATKAKGARNRSTTPKGRHTVTPKRGGGRGGRGGKNVVVIVSHAQQDDGVDTAKFTPVAAELNTVAQIPTNSKGTDGNLNVKVPQGISHTFVSSPLLIPRVVLVKLTEKNPQNLKPKEMDDGSKPMATTSKGKSFEIGAKPRTPNPPQCEDCEPSPAKPKRKSIRKLKSPLLSTVPVPVKDDKLNQKPVVVIEAAAIVKEIKGTSSTVKVKEGTSHVEKSADPPDIEPEIMKTEMEEGTTETPNASLSLSSPPPVVVKPTEKKLRILVKKTVKETVSETKATTSQGSKREAHLKTNDPQGVDGNGKTDMKADPRQQLFYKDDPLVQACLSPLKVPVILLTHVSLNKGGQGVLRSDLNTKKLIKSPPKKSLQVTDKPKESSQQVTDKPKESPQLVTDKPKESPQLVTDKPEEPSQQVTDKPNESSQQVTDKPEEPSQQVTDKPKESPQQVTDKPEEPSQLVTDKPKVPPQLVTDKPNESDEGSVAQRLVPRRVTARMSKQSTSIVPKEPLPVTPLPATNEVVRRTTRSSVTKSKASTPAKTSIADSTESSSIKDEIAKKLLLIRQKVGDKTDDVKKSTPEKIKAVKQVTSDEDDDVDVTSVSPVKSPENSKCVPKLIVNIKKRPKSGAKAEAKSQNTKTTQPSLVPKNRVKYTTEELKRLYGDGCFVMSLGEAEKESDNMFVYRIDKSENCLRQFHPAKYENQNYFFSSPVRWHLSTEELTEENLYLKFQAIPVRVITEERKTDPTDKRKEMVETKVQYPYNGKNFYVRMTKSLGHIYKTECLRNKFKNLHIVLAWKCMNLNLISELRKPDAEQSTLLQALKPIMAPFFTFTDKINATLVAALAKATLPDELVYFLRSFHQMKFSHQTAQKGAACNVCEKVKVETSRVIFSAKGQGWGNPYDLETLVELKPENWPKLPDKPIHLCRTCCQKVLKLHRLIHWVFRMFRNILVNMQAQLEHIKNKTNIKKSIDKVLLWTESMRCHWRNNLFLDFQVCIAEVEIEFEL